MEAATSPEKVVQPLGRGTPGPEGLGSCARAASRGCAPECSKVRDVDPEPKGGRASALEYLSRGMPLATNRTRWNLHRKSITDITANAAALLNLYLALQGAGLAAPTVPPELLLAGGVLVAVVGLVAFIRWMVTRP